LLFDQFWDRPILGVLRYYKVARPLGDDVDNVQEAGISHQSELQNFLAPNITVVRRCQKHFPDGYGLIQCEVMCLKTVDVDRFQDFIPTGQNDSSKGGLRRFDATI
jgi:hypothetical protein